MIKRKDISWILVTLTRIQEPENFKINLIAELIIAMVSVWIYTLLSPQRRNNILWLQIAVWALMTLARNKVVIASRFRLPSSCTRQVYWS